MLIIDTFPSNIKNYLSFINNKTICIQNNVFGQFTAIFASYFDMPYTFKTICLLFCAWNVESRAYVTSIRNWIKSNKISYDLWAFHHITTFMIFDLIVLFCRGFYLSEIHILLSMLSFIQWISINLFRVAFVKEIFFRQIHSCRIVYERERPKSSFLHCLYFEFSIAFRILCFKGKKFICNIPANLHYASMDHFYLIRHFLIACNFFIQIKTLCTC